MEAKICCAYNVSRGCRISSKVTVADCANEPFKLMKVLLDGLAQNAEAGFWLPHLLHTPQIVRLFPFDFVYLDDNLRIIHAAELPPEVPLPRWDPRATSALILPLNSLSLSGTVKSDQVLVCREDDLEGRLAKITPAGNTTDSTVLATVPPQKDVPTASHPLPISAVPPPLPVPFHSPTVSLPISHAAVNQGTQSTFALTSSWQISNITTAAVLMEPVERQEIEPNERLAIPSVALAEGDSAGMQASGIESFAAPSANATRFANAAVVEEAVDGERLGVVEVSGAEMHGVEVAATSAAVNSALEKFAAIPAPEIVPSVDVPGIDTLLLSPHAVSESPTEEFHTESTEFQEDRILAEVVRSGRVPEATSDAPASTATVSTEVRIARSREAAEMAPKVVLPTSNHGQATLKKKSREKKKDALGLRVIRWLNLDDPLPERRKIIRLLLEGLQAYEVDGDESKRFGVRDVCPSGLYLLTDEKWRPGKVLSLVLEKKGANENDHERRVRVQARVVRSDEDGCGLEFVFPEGTEFEPWQRVKTKRSDETEADFILRELRLSRALGFIQRLCPGVAEEVKHALHDRLSNKRVAAAVEIALKAESALVGNKSVGRVFAHNDIVMRVIENGSWIEDDWIRKMWAGVLVSACDPGGQDNSNLYFIDMLAKLTPVHLRIFSFVCHKAVQAIAAGAPEAKLDLYSTAEELMEAADTHSYPRIQQTIGHLSTYGLLMEAARPSYASQTDHAKMRTTPTAQGLKMYARCNGQRVAK